MGDILHMSTMPEPMYCPMVICSVISGNPTSSDRMKNWIMKATADKQENNMLG